MTIREIAEIFAHIGAGKVSAKKWEESLRFCAETQNPFYIGITMPDGNWFAMVWKYGKNHGEWTYYLPDTREQEKRMLGLL